MPARRIRWEAIPPLPRRNEPGNSETSSSNGQTVDVHVLIRLTERHPVTKKPLIELVPTLDHPCWVATDGEHISPRTVIELIKTHGYDEAARRAPTYASHIEKIREADYSFPLHLHEGIVINGMHRLSRVTLNYEMGESSQDFVTVKELKEIPKDALGEQMGNKKT